MSLKIVALCTSERKAEKIEHIRENLSAQNIALKTRVLGIDELLAHVSDVTKPLETAIYILAIDEAEFTAALDLPLGNIGQGVILISDMNSTHSMRIVKACGALDYVPSENIHDELLEAIELVAKRNRSVCKVIGFTGLGGGAGASTLAAAASQFCSTDLGYRTALVDFDLAFGRHGVDFGLNIKANFSKDFVTSKPSELMMDGLYGAASQTLDVFSSPNVQNLADIEPMENSGAFINALRDRYDVVILDIPTALANFDAELLAYVDVLNLTFTPDLQGIRNLSNMLRWLDAINTVAYHAVVNKYDKKSNLTVEDIKTLAKLSDVTAFQNDAVLCDYQMRLDIDARSDIKMNVANKRIFRDWAKLNALTTQRTTNSPLSNIPILGKFVGHGR